MQTILRLKGEDNLDKQRDFYFCCIASCLLRVYNGFISHLHYVITMRLVCDSYPFCILSATLRSGIGVVSGKISMN